MFLWEDSCLLQFHNRHSIFKRFEKFNKSKTSMPLFQNINYFVVTHSLFKGNLSRHGPAHIISNYLKSKDTEHCFIEFPLQIIHKAKTTHFSKNEQVSFYFNTLAQLPLLKHFVEFLCLLILIMRNKNRAHKATMFIGVNPLNACWGIILKYFKIVDVVIFHTADYYFKKYNNYIFNKIYFFIDKIAINNADFVWNVSSRLTTYRIEKQGLKKDKVFFVPNGVVFDEKKILPIKEIQHHQLVMIAGITNIGLSKKKYQVHEVNYEMLFNAISELKQDCSSIKLKIFGWEEIENNLKQIILKKGIEKQIEYFGYRERSIYLNVVSKSGIALALYDNNIEYNYFRDSVRIREYIAYGLPVITSGDHSLRDDLVTNKAGIGIDSNKEDLVRAIKEIFNNYEEYRNNAIQLAKKTDLIKILDNAFEKTSNIL